MLRLSACAGCVAAVLLLSVSAGWSAAREVQTLQLGAAAPDFELTGVDVSCTVAGDNPGSVTVVSIGQIVRAEFNVTCTPESGIP